MSNTTVPVCFILFSVCGCLDRLKCPCKQPRLLRRVELLDKHFTKNVQHVCKQLNYIFVRRCRTVYGTLEVVLPTCRCRLAVLTASRPGARTTKRANGVLECGDEGNLHSYPFGIDDQPRRPPGAVLIRQGRQLSCSCISTSPFLCSI